MESLGSAVADVASYMGMTPKYSGVTSIGSDLLNTALDVLDIPERCSERFILRDAWYSCEGNITEFLEIMDNLFGGEE